MCRYIKKLANRIVMHNCRKRQQAHVCLDCPNQRDEKPDRGLGVFLYALTSRCGAKDRYRIRKRGSWLRLAAAEMQSGGRSMRGAGGMEDVLRVLAF